MTKYVILIIVYLISVVSSTIANLFEEDVQYLYRVPFLKIRWIDVAILIVVVAYIDNVICTNKNKAKYGTTLLFCFLFLVFESFQLLGSWKSTDISWQISGFLCTLNFFILIDFLTFEKDEVKITSFLKSFAVWGALVIIIINTYLLYSFIAGHVVHTDSDIRVSIDVIGQKETVSTSVLIPFVYAFGLYFIQKNSKLWEKVLFIIAILSIYVSLVYSFHRGFLFTILVITIIYFTVFSRSVKQALITLVTISLLIGVFYSMFGSLLKQKGYDPINKIIETAEFAADVNNPNWDKGRSIPREYAISAWQKNTYFGVGYNDLYNFGLPEDIGTAHNFIITSLFHKGIIGTFIYLFILFKLFNNSIKLWFISKENCYQNDLFKLLIIVSFFWLIPFWTQEVIWEKYSLSIQFMYLGIITNIYRQRIIHKSMPQNSFNNNA